jgi:transaldolase/glucose-6-phosphate isomerase
MVSPMFDQQVFPGILQEAFRKEIQSLEKIRAVQRLWAEDTSLWSPNAKLAESFKDKLHWLRLPENLGPQMERVVQAASRLQRESLDEIVFVAMGRSNLAVETITRLSCASLGRRFLLLDSTSPDAIRAIEKEIDLRHTLFIFASKSGKRIETHALLLYFMDKLKVAGVSAPGHQFVALTEENSYLVELARTYHFREIFLDPPGISSLYSSLIHFNLLLSAVYGIAPSILLERAMVMRNACSPQTPPDQNPALQLAAFLGAVFSNQFEKLLFLNSENVDYLAYQMASLVGTSTGKLKTGIVPIFGQNSYKSEMFQRSSVIALKMKDEADEALDNKIAELRQANIPLLSIEIPDAQSLGAELFKWEIATVLFCAHKGIDPFSDPDAKESRQATARILEHVENNRDLQLPRVRAKESGIELRMEGETRQQVSSLSLPEALRTFLELRPADGYLALLPFSPPKPSTIAALRILRDQLVERLAIPVLATSGPRYLHLLGQVYKGGPSKGLFIILTAEPLEDLPIPGAGYTFRQLDLALALGDFETLVHHKRPVLHLHLTQGIGKGLDQLNLLLKQALEHLRFARS